MKNERKRRGNENKQSDHLFFKKELEKKTVTVQSNHFILIDQDFFPFSLFLFFFFSPFFLFLHFCFFYYLILLDQLKLHILIRHYDSYWFDLD